MQHILHSPSTCAQGGLGPSLADACVGSQFFIFMSLLNTYVLNNDKISGKCRRIKPVEKPHHYYDFIVVGGGAAGCVAAARLSEVSGWKVLLLEAGPDEPAGAVIPGFATTFLKTGITWDYKTTNESNVCLDTNGSCEWPSGRNLGGNTAHNMMVYARGNPTDYNRWADLGNDGWTWEEVAPYFLKSEDNGEIERVGREHHSTGGRLSVERFPYVPPFGQSVLEASIEAGYGVSQDINGDTKTGFSRIQAMVKNGVRRSSATAFLRPVRNRRNLDVSLDSTVTKVLMKNDKAVGVEYYKDGVRKTVYATREVVLSAGAVGSPHLLLLSGIGPRDHLSSVGIGVVKDLPGVGENLHDHMGIAIPFAMNEDDVYEDNWAAAAEYISSQSGPLSGTGSVQVLGFLASNATTPEYPDIEIFLLAHQANCAPGKIGALRSTGRRILELIPTILHSKSRGRITLASNDPFELPSIWGNYLDDPEDLDTLVDSIKLGLALFDTNSLRRYNFTMLTEKFAACNDLEFRSDEYLACIPRLSYYPLYHQGGTCKMGPSSDPMAVVDPRLRVHTIKGLRVADTSIMPEAISANTAAPAIMIGERIADFIKEDWNQKFSQKTSSRRRWNKIDHKFRFRPHARGNIHPQRDYGL